jgi:hypothetical protein
MFTQRCHIENVMSRFFKGATTGYDPTQDNRESELPVGLEVCSRYYESSHSDTFGPLEPGRYLLCQCFSSGVCKAA